MRILATLLDADEGSAFLGDIDMLRSKLEVRRLLGYLPQEFGVYPRISAAGMLAISRSCRCETSNSISGITRAAWRSTSCAR